LLSGLISFTSFIGAIYKAKAILCPLSLVV
jgi:hypothetical protein